MRIDLEKHVVMILNAFPPKSGISTIYSSRSIMKGQNIDWKNMCKLTFGTYAQVHEYINITNTMREHTKGVICIGPMGNVKGIYNFLYIRTGKKIMCGQFTKIPA